MSQLFRFRFRTPFVYRNDDREKHNYMENAIVLVDKIPYEQKYVERGEKGFTYISKFEWRVTIDLWIVMMRFNWIGKEQDAKA